MKNMWEGFDVRQQGALVHPTDVELVSRYQSRARSEKYFLQTHMMPEPWVGSRSAPVVVLQANPGASLAECDSQWKPIESQIDCAQQTLNGAEMEYPLYWLDPRLVETDGGRWSRLKLKEAIRDSSLERVARGVLALETHAYHSQMFDSRLVGLRTQEYTAELLRDAIQRGALIIALRAEKFWQACVPELVDYEATGRVIRTSSRQQAALSRNNLKDGYDLFMDALLA